VGGAVALAVGGDHTCAMTDGGALVKCWGENALGELGDGNTTETTAAVHVRRLMGTVVAIDAGASHTCAAIQGGTARCWGNNVYGMIGDGSQNVAASAHAVKQLRGVTVITAGGNHSCALLSTGHAKCWGQNEFGELGDGTSNNDRLTPVTVQGF
jgi:alpha-tubulin suppressor-like RCC1 family protein